MARHLMAAIALLLVVGACTTPKTNMIDDRTAVVSGGAARRHHGALLQGGRNQPRGARRLECPRPRGTKTLSASQDHPAPERTRCADPALWLASIAVKSAKGRGAVRIVNDPAYTASPVVTLSAASATAN